MRFLVIFYILINSSFATDVFWEGRQRKQIEVKIVKAATQSDYLSPLATAVFDLVSENGSTHTLVCSEKIIKTQKTKRSYLNYQNIAHVSVGEFEVTDQQLCGQVARFMEGVFEFIDEDFPMILELSIEKMEVEKIILPDLDPFLDRLPKKSNQSGAALDI